MNAFKFELGVKVKDVITGFTGVVTARCEHITSCNTYAVNPQEVSESKPVEPAWFDENRMELIGDGITLPELNNSKPGAGNLNPDGSRYIRG